MNTKSKIKKNACRYAAHALALATVVSPNTVVRTPRTQGKGVCFMTPWSLPSLFSNAIL